jgi:hypothetical protein
VVALKDQHRRGQAGMKAWLSALALTLTCLGQARAQEPLPPITVRPSGVEDEGAAARERLERLVRRREESAYRFRHICTHCLDGAVVGAPFYPFQALSLDKPE